MLVRAEVNSDGMLKLDVPEALHGKELWIELSESPAQSPEQSWERLEAVFAEADALDFPRKSIEELLRELREVREG